jgi:hypothetical protein
VKILLSITGSYSPNLATRTITFLETLAFDT